MNNADLTPLSYEEKSWFENLDKAIWIHYPGTNYTDNPPWSQRKRELTLEEWNLLKEKIARFRLPCMMVACIYGFGLEIYNHERDQEGKPMGLISVDEMHIPKEERNIWLVSQAVTHTDSNRELLRHYGMPPLKDPGHYSY